MTLILSSSDFAIYNDGILDNTLTGSARLHADIDSAAKGYDSGSLPSSSYCREYVTVDQPPDINDLTFVTVSSSVDGGAYSGSWGDNAISVRAWIRIGPAGSPDAHIFLKSFQIDESNDPWAYSILYEGGANTFRIYAKSSNAGQDTYTGPTLSVPDDTWYRIRLDYIPVGTMKDILNFYTSSAGGTNTETWELVDTVTILSSDNWYITASTPSAVGYSVVDYSNSAEIWIDDFDVYVTPVG